MTSRADSDPQHSAHRAGGTLGQLLCQQTGLRVQKGPVQCIPSGAGFILPGSGGADECWRQTESGKGHGRLYRKGMKQARQGQQKRAVRKALATRISLC